MRYSSILVTIITITLLSALVTGCSGGNSGPAAPPMTDGVMRHLKAGDQFTYHVTITQPGQPLANQVYTESVSAATDPTRLLFDWYDPLTQYAYYDTAGNLLVHDDAITPDVVLLPNQLTAGMSTATWSEGTSLQVTGPVLLTVPAGTFWTFKVTDPAADGTHERWYAPALGYRVREVVIETSSGLNMTMELTSSVTN